VPGDVNSAPRIAHALQERLCCRHWPPSVEVGLGDDGVVVLHPPQAIANEITRDEVNHVAFLRGALGSAAPPIPLVSVLQCN